MGERVTGLDDVEAKTVEERVDEALESLRLPGPMHKAFALMLRTFAS